MSTEIRIREANVSDVDVIAHHRVAMFTDMGRTSPESVEPLRRMTREFLVEALARGEYVGFLASPAGQPERIVSGAGVQVRRVLPFPFTRDDGSVRAHWGAQAIVINVYTEPDYRRRGYARRLMLEVIAWARRSGQESLVLHTSREGAALYEGLGFKPTMELRFSGELGPPRQDA